MFGLCGIWSGRTIFIVGLNISGIFGPAGLNIQTFLVLGTKSYFSDKILDVLGFLSNLGYYLENPFHYINSKINTTIPVGKRPYFVRKYHLVARTRNGWIF